MASVISKIGNANLLRNHRRTAPHVPATRWLSLESLGGMLRRHSMVYVKPNDCCKGSGIIRVERGGEGKYRVRTREGQVTSHRDPAQVLARIRRVQIRRRYIVQQGIRSVTRDGRFFDIRVHLLRIGGEWRMAGAVGKVATKSRIVTNRHSGGKPVAIDELLGRGLGYGETGKRAVLDRLRDVCVGAARAVGRAHPKWRAFGVDIGIDPEGKIWIYEVNITPGLMVFKQGDRAAFHRILNMRKQAV